MTAPSLRVTPAPGPAARPAVRRRPTVALPVLVSLLLTAPFLGRAPLWADEVDSVDAATRSWRDLGHLLVHQDLPLGLYYVLLHLWTGVVGTSEVAVRLPSVLAVATAVGLVSLTARRLAGETAGVLAGLVLATSPFVASYALDARPYALELACGAGLLLVVVTAPDRPGRGRRLAYVGLLVVGTGLHLFLLLFVPAHLLALRLRRRPLRPWAVPVGAALVLVGPLVALASLQTAEVGYLRGPGLLSPLGWLQSMAGGVPWVAVPLLAVAVVVLRRVPGSTRGVVLCLLLVPGAALLAVSTVHPLFLNRYVLFSTAALALGVGVGAARAPRVPRAVVGAVLGLAALATTIQLGQGYRYEDLRQGADLVVDAARPSDGLVFAPATVRTAASYYLSRSDAGSSRPADPLLASAIPETSAGNFGGVEGPAAVGVAAVAGHRRVWRMSWHDGSATRTATDRTVLALLHHRYRLVSRTLFGHLVVEEFLRTGR